MWLAAVDGPPENLACGCKIGTIINPRRRYRCSVRDEDVDGEVLKVEAPQSE